jgi:hypothetical protein
MGKDIERINRALMEVLSQHSAELHKGEKLSKCGRPRWSSD